MNHHSRDADRIREILHYTHSIDSFARLFSDLIKSYRAWKPFSKARIVFDTYLASSEVLNLQHWMRKYIILCRFLDMRRYYVDELADIVQRIHSPRDVATPKGFDDLLQHFMSGVKFFDKDLMAKAERLTCSECIRLDEALVCYENYAYHASVIMAVSAVEARITELIRRKNKRLYNSELSKFTLGQLITIFEPGQFMDKKYEGIKKLMPDKHRPLVALLNRYRVFSAHPTGEAITAQIADSIMHLAFAFMLDNATCPYTENELKHK